MQIILNTWTISNFCHINPSVLLLPPASVYLLNITQKRLWKADCSVRNSFSTNIPSSVFKMQQDICLRRFLLKYVSFIKHFISGRQPSRRDILTALILTTHISMFSSRQGVIFISNLIYQFVSVTHAHLHERHFSICKKRNAERDWRRRAIFLNLIWCFWEEKGLRGTTVALVLAVPSWRPDDKCF